MISETTPKADALKPAGDTSNGSVTGRLAHWVELHGDRLALGLLQQGDTLTHQLDYRTLQSRIWGLAQAVAPRLVPGERALLLYSSPLEFITAFLACLEAGVIAIPAPPPEASRLKRTLPRLLSIVADSGAGLILADPPTLALLEQLGTRLEGLANLPRLDTSAVPPSRTAFAPRRNRQDIAYLQYTSGSIGRPKGAMVSQRSLMANLAYNRELWRYDPDSVAVHWMPYFHDYGLVEGLLQPLYSGIPGYVMPTVAFLRSPLRWLKAISTFKASHSASPDFGYLYCVERTRAADHKGLDLRSWRVASNGAEVVRPTTLDRFSQTFAGSGFSDRAFYPSYGLAEATLLLTAKQGDAAPTRLRADAQALEQGQLRAVDARDSTSRAFDLIGCGGPGPSTDLRIVNPDSHTVCQEGEIGEIWARGAGIAKGYWQRPEESQQSFGATLVAEKTAPAAPRPSQNSTAPAQGYLRTGDLGAVLDGELYVTGRLKDLIVIRGSNHFPQDIEATLAACHPTLQGCEAAAFSFPDPQDGRVEALGLVVEVPRRLSDDVLPGLFEAAQAAIAEAHDIALRRLAFIGRGGLAKTSSGKIQRRSCRQAFLENRLEKLKAVFTTQLPRVKSCLVEGDAESSRQKADLLLAGLRDLARDRLDSRQMDDRRTPPPHLILEFGNLGLLGLQVPEALGGQGLLTSDAMRVLEQLGALDLSLGVFTVLQNGLGLRPLLTFGREDQKQQLLPELASGRRLIAFAYTEPAAGSNVRGIETTAQAEADNRGLRLTGEKIWSGSSAWAHYLHSFAREKDVEGAPLGISAFLLRRGMAGFSTGPEADTMGLRATVQNKVHFRAVALAQTDRIGAPGQGLEVAQDAMRFTRLCLAALCLGAMKEMLRLRYAFVKKRQVITGRLLDHPSVRLNLLAASSAITALDALVGATARLADSAEGAPEDLYSALKILAPELLWQVTDETLQQLGGRGYMENNRVAQVLRDARAIRVFEGPTEAVRHHLGARVTSQPQALEPLLRADLGGQDAARQLTAALTDLAGGNGQDGSDSAADNRDLRLLRNQQAGEAAAWAIAFAALEGQTTGTVVTAATTRSLTWVKTKLDETLARLTRRAALEPALPAGEAFQSLIDSYESAIGPAARQRPGMEQQLDAELRPDPGQRDGTAPVPAAPATPSPDDHRLDGAPIPPQAPRSVVKADGQTQTGELGNGEGKNHDPGQAEGRRAGASPSQGLEDWIINWLSQTLGLTKTVIDRSRAFATLGMDSVSATNLAMDLESHLERPVDATLIWDYPSIAKLAAFLATDRSVYGPALRAAKTSQKPAPTPPAAPRSDSVEDELDALLKEVEDL